MKLPIALVACALVAQSAIADPQMLILSGDTEFPRYKNISKLAFETAKAKGYKIQIAAGDGSWNFADSKTVFPAASAAQVEDRIRQAALALKPGETFLLFINDHGAYPTRPADPLTAGVVLSPKGPHAAGSNVSDGETAPKPDSAPVLGLEHLGEMLQKYVPSGSPIKFVGVQCYSGGLHALAAKLANACAAASTDHLTQNISEEDYSQYAKAFWEAFQNNLHDYNKDGKTSLFEAHLAGYENDSRNAGRGQLSSMAFVDSVLKEGAHHPSVLQEMMELESEASDTSPPPAPSVRFPDSPRMSTMERALNKTWNERYERDLAQQRKSGNTSSKVRGDHFTPGSETVRPTATADTKLGDVALSFEQMRQRVAALRTTKSALPAELLNATALKLEYWENKQREYADRLKSAVAKYDALRVDWKKLPLEEQKKRNRDFTLKFDGLERQTQKELAPLLGRYGRLIDDFDKVTRFMKIATLEQTTTLKRLLKCESQPL